MVLAVACDEIVNLLGFVDVEEVLFDDFAESLNPDRQFFHGFILI